MKLTKVSIDRPVGVSMFYLAVVILGFISLRQLSVDLVPDISYGRFSVVTRFPGAAAEEIETLVTEPLEIAVGRIPGIRRVESISKEGFSCLTLEFAWGTDLEFAMLHTREALDSARESLPAGAEKPSIIRFDPRSRPIMVLAISGENSLLELKEFAEELVKPRLEQIDGIGSAEITGGVEREIQVEINPQLLALYLLTVDEVAAQIGAFNRNIQAGTIRKGLFKYALRVVGEFESIKEIGEITLKTTGKGGTIRLKDIAKVKDGIKERQGMTHLNNQESIGILVRKIYASNTVRTTRLVKKVLDQIRLANPGIQISVVSEQAGYIEAAIRGVKNEIVQGAILVFLVVLVFLQELKSPLIINMVIPISIFATFNLLYFCNISLNIMSLGGLALGVGMLDDCADVISENIFRHRSLGEMAAEAAYRGTKEVAGAVASTALTTVVVFLPIIYVHGAAGQMFKDASLTVTFSILASLLIALSLLPMLHARDSGIRSDPEFPRLGTGGSCRQWPHSGKKMNVLLYPWRRMKWLLYGLLKEIYLVCRFFIGFLVRLVALTFRYLKCPLKPVQRIVFRTFNNAFSAFVDGYRKRLEWSLDHKAKISAASLVLFVAAFFIGSRIPREHLPPSQSTSFELRLKNPIEYSLEQTAAIGLSIGRYLSALGGVKVTFSQIGIVSGMESLDSDISLNSARIHVEVETPGQLESVLGNLRRRLSSFPDVSFSIVKEQSTLPEFLAFTSSEVGLKVKGDDPIRLQEIASGLVGKLTGVKGIVDLSANIGEGKPEFRIHVKKDVPARHANLSPQAISGFLVGAVRGKVATQFSDGEKKIDILVRFDESARASLVSLLNRQLPHQGSLIPLRDLVSCELAWGPREIRRENRQREIMVTASLRDRKISQVAPAIIEKIKQLHLPENYQIVFSGEREEMSQSFKGLSLAIAISILLTYMIMAAQFESLLHPFLIMLTLPMGAAGAFVALFLTRQTLNVISLIGFVVLVGLVVDDAIVEVDFINQLRRSGRTLRDSVVEGCMTRLRPILMASLDTVIGLVPMALALERGSELLRPLGIVVMGGLLFSTFLTLIQIPVAYEWLEQKRDAGRRSKN